MQRSDSAGTYSLDNLLVLPRLQSIAQGRLALILFIDAVGRALMLAWHQKIFNQLQ